MKSELKTQFLSVLIMATIVQRPIAAAVLHASEKTPVGSALRSAEWAEMPLALREQAQFSAGLESARVLGRIQTGLLGILSGSRNEFGVIEDRSKLIADITRLAAKEGLRPDDPDLVGTVQDITSERRAELIYEMQTGQAYGRANFKAGMDEDVLNAAPAWELVRVEARKEPRDWKFRWHEAGGRFWGGERMIALKTDPVWQNLSRFGTRWPPFDFNSGMGVEDVLRGECIRLGLISPNTRLVPVDANAVIKASVKDIGPELRNVLREHFGDQIAIDGDTVQWKGGAAAYEQTSQNRRQSARLRFPGIEGDLGSIRPPDDGTEVTRGLQAAIAREGARQNAAEITAVASGRKPLFHEWVSADPAEAERVARSIQKKLPAGIIARAEGGQLFVYNPDLVGRLADPNKPLWPQVLANSDNGRWLGYGLNRGESLDSVLITIQDASDNTVYGFDAPSQQAR
ncbi:MAG TPA: hypothetical protein PKA41_15710, partial [Verrucomicrobiota bacterium]|nr:hypothetical protein [Verrucomicrobiota bacterium]